MFHLRGQRDVNLEYCPDVCDKRRNLFGSFFLGAKDEIIDNNEDIVIAACQNYLIQCEEGKKHFMSPDIDGILAMFDKLSSETEKDITY